MCRFCPKTLAYHYLLILLAFYCLPLYLFCLQETLDRIVAVVNDEVIVLTDLKIVEAFGLYEPEEIDQEQDAHFRILQRLIDQKLVIQFTSETISVPGEELETGLQKIIKAVDNDQFAERLEQFDMDLKDLEEYLYEKMLCQKILSQKFSQAATVSLKEIEEYYQQQYVPSQKAEGLEPQPMLGILDEIESAIKRNKMEKQIEEWIRNLRKESDIQIKTKKETGEFL